MLGHFAMAMRPKCPLCGAFLPLVANPGEVDEEGVKHFTEWKVAPCTECPQLLCLQQESEMSYTMQEGEVYRLARSLRHEGVFGLPPGTFAPEIVAVDAETAAAMNFTGVLLYLDGNSVAVFDHNDDKNFVLGMVVDPNAQEQIAADAEGQVEVPEEQPAEPEATEPTPDDGSAMADGAQPVTSEMMAEWGMADDAVCDCGYYVKDHTIVTDGDGNPGLQCPAGA